ncbi:MAG: membrane protein insertase YidC [Bacteroidota bacterium]
MDRNSIIGFSLIFLILTGYYWYTSPTDAELKEQARQDSIALVAQKATQAEQNKQVASEQSTTGKTKDSATLDSTLIGSIGSFAQQVNGDNKEISIGNKEITLGIQTRGAGIGRVTLNNYKRSDSSKLELLEPNSNRWFFELFTSNGPLKSSDFVWKVEAQSASMVRLRLGDSLQHIDLTYRLDLEGFEVYSQLKLVGVDQLIKARNSGVRLEWNAQLHKQERDFKWENQNSTVAYKLVGEDPDKLSEASEGEEVLKNRVQWVAFKQQYFSSVMLAKDGFSTDAKLGWTAIPENRQLETGKIKAMSAELYLDYEREKEKVYDLSYYFGPNQYYTMQEAKLGGGDHQLQRIIPMGWGIFGWVNRYVVVPVFHALDGIIGSMGIIILLLTVIIKTALLPLVYKSYISTAKMRILKPELDEIKEKHGNDMQKMQSENMALYRKAGVSPLSGCVPMLLQLPILFAMFQFFPNAFELRQKSFLWAMDLSQYDGPSLGFNIPFYGDHVSFFTILMTVSTLIYTHLNNQISGVTGQMKYIGYIMPIIFLGVLNDYASGLTWYYFVSNMITFGQQWVIRRTVDDTKLHAQIAENRKKPATKSKFQQRMEEAMKMSQQRAAANAKGKKK